MKMSSTMFSNQYFCFARPSGMNMRMMTKHPLSNFCSNASSEDGPKKYPKMNAINSEKHEFKAETKKLLDIVAKSIYTDKEVFIRELMSNASDALEKQRIYEVSGKAEMKDIPLEISIFTNEKERSITIFDHGIGMTKDEVIDNLGTIAKSGSQNFVKALQDEAVTGESIIGQFGVGFYSSFIVADSVEVVSKSDQGKPVRWISDGSGDYEVAEMDTCDFNRGTRVTMYLKPEDKVFSKASEVNKILKKHSLFISYPIKLNGEVVNSLQAIWYRSKSEVNDDEYDKFYENLANTKVPYRYMIHYSTDVPLSIKALLYIPGSNAEKFGQQQEASDLHLYSRKVLIKQKCSELLPHYFRFVKGVVDCEDLPLNISRENYQDSNLIAKLRSTLSRRVIKLLEDEAKKDPERYLKWYNEFQNYLKEGLSVDRDLAAQILKLMRYHSTKSEGYIDLDEYIASMKPNQKNIYFIVTNNPNTKNVSSPFIEPFIKSNVPVIVLPNHIDEVCLRNVNEYKGLKFVNIESNFDEVAGDLDEKIEHDKQAGIPEAEITPFSLWLKSELTPTISKVTISKRLANAPAVIVGQVSSSLRAMLAMVDQAQFEQAIKDQSLEVNPNHPLMVKLNKIRKQDTGLAKLLLGDIFNNVKLQSGIPYDTQKASQDSYKVIEMLMDYKIEYGQDEPEIIVEDVQEPAKKSVFGKK